MDKWNEKDRASQVSIGYGARYDFTKKRDAEVNPGPGQHNYHIKNSIDYKSAALKKNKQLMAHSFYNKWDKSEKICY